MVLSAAQYVKKAVAMAGGGNRVGVKTQGERTNERARGTCHKQQVLYESCSAWCEIFEMLKQNT